MKSTWKVSTNVMGAEKFYQIYRLYDVQKIDNSGNREVYNKIFEDKEEAIVTCRELNAEENYGGTWA